MKKLLPQKGHKQTKKSFRTEILKDCGGGEGGRTPVRKTDNPASPSAVHDLTFPPIRSRGQDQTISSFINSGPLQSLGGFVPCLNDAGISCRRKPEADVHGLSRESEFVIVRNYCCSR